MNEIVALASCLTAVVALLSWLIKTVIGNYHIRLDRHDVFMDNLFKRENQEAALRIEVDREMAQQMAKISESVGRVVTAVNENTQIARMCEEVASRQIAHRMQKAQARGEPLSS